MPSQAPSEAPSADTVGSITPDMPEFREHLAHRGVYDADLQNDPNNIPDNWDDLKKIVNESRDSPEPDDQQHAQFKLKVRTANNESGLIAILSPRFLKAAWAAEDNIEWQHDQQWTRHVPLRRVMSPRLADPKPDQSFGWRLEKFDGLLDANVSAILSIPVSRKKRLSFASPCADLYWPVATVEGKGAAGQLRQAHLQNLNNASIMLNNLFELKKRVDPDSIPSKRAMVVTVELTAETAQLNCHWACRNATSGQLNFWGKTPGSWGLHSPKRQDFIEARRCILNCIEWVRKTTLAEIVGDLGKLRQAPNRLVLQTPPASESSQAKEQQQSEKGRVTTDNVRLLLDKPQTPSPVVVELLDSIQTAQQPHINLQHPGGENKHQACKPMCRAHHDEEILHHYSPHLYRPLKHPRAHEAKQEGDQCCFRDLA